MLVDYEACSELQADIEAVVILSLLSFTVEDIVLDACMTVGGPQLCFSAKSMGDVWTGIQLEPHGVAQLQTAGSKDRKLEIQRLASEFVVLCILHLKSLVLQEQTSLYVKVACHGDICDDAYMECRTIVGRNARAADFDALVSQREACTDTECCT